MHGVEKIVVAKPVATRPHPIVRSFSELPSGAIDDSPHTSLAETTVSVRPKTIRFKPSLNPSPAEPVSSMDDVPEPPVCFDKASIMTSRGDSTSNVLYKPMARVVSRTTASLLANMGNEIYHEQALDEHAMVQVPDQGIQNQHTTNLHQDMPLYMRVHSPYEPYLSESSNLVPVTMDEDIRTPKLPSTGVRSSYDGYNWRKYGQKQVKGSECPRSYYKCTHPTCLVKKKLERSLDGEIAEIVYKGEHNHPKPIPPKRLPSASQKQTLISDEIKREIADPLWGDPIIEKNLFDASVDVHNEVDPFGLYTSKIQYSHDSLLGAADSSVLKTPEASGGLSGDSMLQSMGAAVDTDMPKRKTRKKMEPVCGAAASMKGNTKPQSAVQTSKESDVSGDGFRWRKYGQKAVRGNSYPRCYYRCISPKCGVRKYVERSHDNPSSFITTYEGKHNHDQPQRKVNKVLRPMERAINGEQSQQSESKGC